MPASVKGPTPAQRRVRGVLVAGYVGFVALGLVSDVQPRVFWTMLLPLLLLAIVLMGFYTWRNVCPLAFFGELGSRLNGGLQRRVPPWLERWFFPVTFGTLLSFLVLRLLATNGDRWWLTGMLVCLALAAALTNTRFTGKTWCNFVCPVGFVERVYTEPASLRPAPRTSLCAKCTACKRHCPDIDQENAYWKDVLTGGRRTAIYAFPGLVLGFYSYYFLRGGEWEAYFDGQWTLHRADAALAAGPGLFFAPAVPAALAAPLTLVAFSAASYALFLLVEAALRRRTGDPERSRHLGLALAAFTAFNLFYVFAGAPSLRHVPGGIRSAAFVAPLVATLFLVKRWRRTPEHFVGERGAARLLRAWPYPEPPPKDPREVYAWIQASRHAREKDVAAYAATVREMIAEGVVQPSELRLLDGMRKQLGISEREHEQILARLSEEERQLFEEGAAPGVEAHAQLEGYQAALAQALLRAARDEEIDELRRTFGVSARAHETALARIRGPAGELLSRARRQLDRARQLARDLGTIGATEPTAARIFLRYLLTRARDESLDRLVELLEVAGDGPTIHALRRRLFASDPAQREPALEVLALACPGAEQLLPELESVITGGSPTAAERDGEAAVLARLLGETNPFLRAGAVWAAAGHAEPFLQRLLAQAVDDAHPLVREAARHFAAPSPAREAPASPPASLATVETMHFLHAAPFFAELDPGDLYDLAELSIEETVVPPATVCEAGATGEDALFVVVSGKAVVVPPTRGDASDDSLPIATLGRGDVIGELSVLDGSPRSATVRPEAGPVSVLRMPGPRVRGILLRPRVAESLLGMLAGRMRRLVHDAASSPRV
jgi:hypothetical protein